VGYVGRALLWALVKLVELGILFGHLFMLGLLWLLGEAYLYPERLAWERRKEEWDRERHIERFKFYLWLA